MKKLAALILLVTFGFATSAKACPKGETMTGGTGKHHKGGICAPKVAKEGAAKPAAKK